MKIICRTMFALSVFVTASSLAQTYPTKSIQLIIPAAPGGGVDSVGRIIATNISEGLGQPVVATNMAGAGTMIASEHISRATPDGHSILMATSSHIVNAAVRKNLRYDAIKDFSPIALVGSTPDLLVVNSQSDIKSVGDLIAFAKKDPGKITFGSSGLGSLSNLEVEMFQDAAKIKVLGVPYKGGVPAVTGLLSKQIDALFLGVVALAPHIKSGALRPIAVTSSSRLADFPDVPTMAESGFPGWNTETWYGAVAPANTPASVIEILNKQINTALKNPEVRKQLSFVGIQPASNSSSEAFAAAMQADYMQWKNLVNKIPHLMID